MYRDFHDYTMQGIVDDDSIQYFLRKFPRGRGTLPGYCPNCLSKTEWNSNGDLFCSDPNCGWTLKVDEWFKPNTER